MGLRKAGSADVWGSLWRGDRNAKVARRSIAVALLIGLFSSCGTLAQQNQSAAPKPAQIDRNGVILLIRSTLLALDQANKTGNYTVLRDLGAPGFQANSDARLAEIFASQRRDKLDLSGVAVLDPQLTLLPQIEANGMMHMAGFFPSVPTQVNFELLFQPVDGRVPARPFKEFSVGLGSAAPTAPQPQAEAPHAAPPKTPLKPR